jgi:hypothetical protein
MNAFIIKLSDSKFLIDKNFLINVELKIFLNYGYLKIFLNFNFYY